MAADVSARVHLVAEKLQQKAQDAQRKGNEGAARALAASVADLRQAVALIAEQRHLLARRRGEGVDADDDADAPLQELSTRLARVESMLGQKASDMRAKGNEGAANALQQSAVAVERARTVLQEQQQRVFGLLGRWEKLESALNGEEKVVVTSDDEGDEERDEKEQQTAQGRVIARVRQLSQLNTVFSEAFPGCESAEDVQEELNKLRKSAEASEELVEAQKDCSRLRNELESTTKQLEESRREAQEAAELVNEERAAREDVKKALETQQERERQRQEEDAELLEQQREACQAMEQLVRESDQEIHRLTQSTAADMEELQLLRADVDAMSAESERLRKAHADEVEELHRQLESQEAALSAETEEDVAEEEQVPNVDEGEEGDNVETDDVPVLELEDEALEAVEDEVEASSDGQEDAVNVAQDASEAQTAVIELQSQLVELEERSQAQQGAISTLERERIELREQIETLTKDQTHIMDDLRSSYDEEASRSMERIAKSEESIKSLTAELAEAQEAAGAVAAQEREAAEALQRCEAELSTCRDELKAQTVECSRLQEELQTVRRGEDSKRGEVDARVSLLAKELQELASTVGEVKMGAEAVEALAKRTWTSPEVTELCSSLCTPLGELITGQKQLQNVEQQLDALRIEKSQQTAAIEQFLQSNDGRLLPNPSEEEQESSSSLAEQLAIAAVSVSRWLQELRKLADQAKEDATTLQSIESESQQRVALLEAAKHELEVLVEALQTQLETLQREKKELETSAERLKAQSHSASEQEQQQQEEVADLQQQLAATRSDFEKYRARSHAALKKMEKRAELLNGMRKENEALLKQVEASEQQREAAETARSSGETRLQEVERCQQMLQVEFEQFATEKARAIADSELEAQRLTADREQLDQQLGELTQQIQAVQLENAQLEEQSERVKEAELAAFQARLETASAAVQTAKQDTIQAQEALAASKAESKARQQRIESLETTLQQVQEQRKAMGATASTNSSPAVVAAPVSASPVAEGRANGVELELTALRTSETLLRQQVDDARAELIALQERFATTKAANAEKVFALEEQSRHWELQLSAANEEARRLSEALEATGLKPQPSSEPQAAAKAREQLEASVLKLQQLEEEVHELKTEQTDANTEVALLTRALDACREELQDAQDQLKRLSSSTYEPESGEDPLAAELKGSSVLAAKEEALKKLRLQVLELQEELQQLREEKAAREVEREQEELSELQADRQQMHVARERAMQLQKRQALVTGFQTRASTIVDELQQRLEDHSAAFRDVCEFRDDHSASLLAEDGGESVALDGDAKSEPEFEECLVMRSGVVIKAGASFQLPVICEKRGWRVVWNFTVTEEAADVAFQLTAIEAEKQREIVEAERMHELSGEFLVAHDATTLRFEWDNAFSWLNEKTLDYHVSVQEPLSRVVQQTRRSERELQSKAKLIQEGLALLQGEAQRRRELSETLERLEECESAKNECLAAFAARRTALTEQKTEIQEEMETQKTAFAAMLQEQDELEDSERGVELAWETAKTEREDVEMTLRLAGTGAQLEVLEQALEQQKEVVTRQLEEQKTEEIAEPTQEEAEPRQTEEAAQAEEEEAVKPTDASTAEELESTGVSQ
ncbi:hypothetical protein BBJ28_00010851 [Nothophytophthora sp. Chile5]|nr:hypothetical protein BBJ28_00010851 [Nothophytophthora sp. Chile5]